MTCEHFIGKSIKNIERNLRYYLDSEAPQYLHKYRVEVKKLKAIYSFIVFSQPESYKKELFRIHQKMFRRSGKIRDYDVIQQLTEKGKSNNPEKKGRRYPNSYIAALEKFCFNIPAYLKKLKKSEKSFKRYITYQSKIELQNYLQNRKQKVRKLLNKIDSKKKIHQVRKVSKTIVYLSKITPSKNTTEDLYYDKLQKNIGLWHNNILLLESIKNAKLKKKIEEKIKHQLNQIIELRDKHL